MTINALHKQLGELIAAGHGRKVVHIRKDTFVHVLEEDGCLILPVEEASIQTFTMMGDDGGCAFDSKGREIYRTHLVLMGQTQEDLDAEARLEKELEEIRRANP